MVRRKPSRAFVWVMCVMAVMLFSSACERAGSVQVTNRTDVTLTVSLISEEVDRPLPSVSPGETKEILGGMGSGCPENTSDLIIEDPEGRELARFEPPICMGDSFVIDESGGTKE